MGRNPQVWLKDGDVVEVALEGVGTCTNKVEFVGKQNAKLSIRYIDSLPCINLTRNPFFPLYTLSMLKT